MPQRLENDCGLFDVNDDVIKLKIFPCYWPFVRGIHRSPVHSPHKGQWREALMFSLICTWINGWVKQSWGWWFESLSRPLWRHYDNGDYSLVLRSIGATSSQFYTLVPLVLQSYGPTIQCSYAYRTIGSANQCDGLWPVPTGWPNSKPIWILSSWNSIFYINHI